MSQRADRRANGSGAASRRHAASVLGLVSAAWFLLMMGAAEAASMRQAIAAFNRQNYMLAAQVFTPYAERGDPTAQAYLGFMYETGRGVPQNYTDAAMWYRRAAEQGDSLAQYSLGLLYDRGFGVPQDIVEAGKWLNLATAGAPPRAREARARIRDAVTTKMTRGEIAQARLKALEWVPKRER
ncbi:sel1 repeat family protein [Bradyrhizobium lablabi]|uniref:tetratricopeptide repeat protein n=1 Tax=Bradyrhizobium lablabi TaxID=722472 RepID=UPI001BAE38D6|nr:tetratricopeptide repeat protein [Bradyrhizobium lablabi]MBR1120134.1 sel1 repeat family protein [Bradyrhizobium lablabi]